MRELYDKKIRADELRVGDELHLTFMGGDDYVSVLSVETKGDETTWTASGSACDLGDTCKNDQMVWVKLGRPFSTKDLVFRDPDKPRRFARPDAQSNTGEGDQ